MVTIYDPAIGGADGVGKILCWFGRMVICKKFVDVASLIGTIFGDFPFIPDLDVAIL